MADIAALTRMIEPEAKALGLALVRVKMFGGASDPTLQVMAERPDTRQLTIDDCAALSRRISDRLDEARPKGAIRSTMPIGSKSARRGSTARSRGCAISPIGRGMRRGSTSPRHRRRAQAAHRHPRRDDGDQVTVDVRKHQPVAVPFRPGCGCQAADDRRTHCRNRAALSRGRGPHHRSRRVRGWPLPFPPIRPNCSRSPMRSRRKS